jgi:invasion associated locus B (IalB) protein
MRLIVLLLTTLAAGVAAETAGAENRWILETGQDPSTFETVAVLRQDSATTIKDERATRDVTPSLEFRCKPGDPSVIASIDWRRFISSFSTEAGFKVDGGRFTWLKWKVDRTEKRTSSPSAADSQKLIELLKSGHELLVEISPYSEGPVTTQFDLTGFAEAIDKLSASCR